MFDRLSLKRLSVAGIFILAFTFSLREINQTGGGYANFPDRVITNTEKMFQFRSLLVPLVPKSQSFFKRPA